MQRIFAAFLNSRRALSRAFTSEPAVRQELLLLVIALPLAWIITTDSWRYSVLIGTVLIVVAVELLNTAIEKLCDHLHSDRHDNIGYVKDLGSAAVLMSLLTASLVWLVALWQWLDRVL
jgi:diacylglycerol kinase (ATP)